MNIQKELMDGALGGKIHLTCYIPDTTRRVVILVHGFREFGERYSKWAEKFAGIQCAFFAHDQRGHGRTPGKHGSVSSYDLFLKDIDCVRRKVADEYPDLPVILYGHSMGGNIVLNYILKGFAGSTGSDGSQLIPITCAILTSPWLRLPKQPPRLLIKALAGAGRIFPNFMIKPSLGELSRDIHYIKDIDPESLMHNCLGINICCQIIQAGEYALAHADKITIPTLLMRAELDEIVSAAAVEEFAKKSGDHLEYKSWDMCHELHNDFGRDQVFEHVAQFINRHAL
ncbi:MAG: lysophospholipase [Peptococcaceae bacterium]|nr:lysophospholipase [Peptococcaceae bacterium]